MRSKQIKIEVDERTGELFYTNPPPNRIDERAPISQIYEVKSTMHNPNRGESLFTILRRLGRSGADWRELYNIPENKELIGEYIYGLPVGARLIVPEGWRIRR